jgi:hypothetical protein
MIEEPNILGLFLLWFTPVVLESIAQIIKGKFNKDHLVYSAIPAFGYLGLTHYIRR